MVTHLSRRIASFCISIAWLLPSGDSAAAVFPASATATDNARIEITDSSGGLSYNPASVTPAPNALTVMAWVKLSIPTGTDLTSNMTILGNRKSLDWNSPHAFRFYFNINTGNLEFSARGTSQCLTFFQSASSGFNQDHPPNGRF